MIHAFLLAATFAVRPDYLGLTVPPNVAPLNFDLDRAAKVTLVSSAGGRLEKSGLKIRFALPEWRAFLSDAKGGWYEVRIVDASETLVATNTVSADPIDPYLSYRLIPPSYTSFDAMRLAERSLEDFTETTIYDNRQTTRKQCVNCHTPCRGDPSTTLFHVRAVDAGTVIASPKYGLKRHNLPNVTDSPGGGAYPAWHPSGDHIAFSVNHTRQSFYLTDPAKIEVADFRSDLLLYSLSNRTSRVIENEPDIFECFPTWSPDGRTLYSVRARVTPPANTPTNDEACSAWLFLDLAKRYGSTIRYDLVRRDFDERTLAFTPPEMILDAQKLQASFLFPRISPDGRWCVLTVASCGVFPIWHREANLYILDLLTGTLRACDEINSGESDSYHGFSTNGRWMVFSSRRLDDVYTRPFFAHFDPATGRFSKPFLLPVEDPDEHDRRFLSYNVPEFMTGPVPHSPAALRRILLRHHTAVQPL